ncbi:MAG: PspC domain-containing protein [bacterium]
MAEKKEASKPAKVAQPQEEVPRRIYRSRADRMLGGVCAGFAEYFNIDPNVLRVIWVIAAIFGGFGILAYIVSWIIVPENPNQSEQTSQGETKPRNSALIWGVILIFVGLFFLFRELDLFDYYPFRWHWPPFGFGFFRFDVLLPLLIILIGVVYLVGIMKKEKQPQEGKSKQATGGKKLEKKLTRSAKDRMIGGVCGGIANYFNIDPSLVRIVWALLTIAGNLVLGVVAYVVMLIIIPEESVIESPTPASKATTSKSQNK